MEFDDAAAAAGNGGDFDDMDAVQDEIVALEEGEVPIATAEPAAHGQAGDPLEVLYKHHPETVLDYAEKVMPMIPLQQVPPNQGSAASTEENGDPLHKSQPFLSVYETTKLIGFRANQLAQGARPYITVPDHVTRTQEIARMELEQRRLPFIIKRPMPDGSFEYWRLSDLMVI